MASRLHHSLFVSDSDIRGLRKHSLAVGQQGLRIVLVVVHPRLRIVQIRLVVTKGSVQLKDTLESVETAGSDSGDG